MEYLDFIIANWRHIAGFIVIVGGIVVVYKTNTGHSVNEFQHRRRF